MPSKYDWPAQDKRSLIGKRLDRLDGPEKASGRAKYSYDMNRPGMLVAKLVISPHAHAKIKSIDTSEAEKVPGVRAVQAMAKAGDEVTIATSDGLQRDLALGRQVKTVSALTLKAQVDGMLARRDRQMSDGRAQSDIARRLEDRLDPKSRERLERLRRGETPPK